MQKKWYFSLVFILLLLISGITAACDSSEDEDEPSDESSIANSIVNSIDPRIYHVSTSGDDTADGTPSKPWRTIQHAADSVAAGDTVMIHGGVYNEAVTIHVSGSAADGFITLMSAEGETAVLDGTPLSSSGGDIGIQIKGQQYIIIKGMEIRNYKTIIPNAVPMGIAVTGASHHIELRDNEIHHIETNAPVDGDLMGADAHGIAFYGDASDSIHDIVIDGNQVHDLKLGSSEALVLNGNVERFIISHNSVHDTDNIAIVMIGFEEVSPDSATDRARDGVVSDNLVYNVNSSTNPAYGGDGSSGGDKSADGIYVDGGMRIVIERNTVHHANLGMEITSEHGGGDASSVTVRNNLIYQNEVTGIGIGGYDDKRGSTHDCIFVNNTFFQNDTLQDGMGEMLIQYDVHDNVIKNNIFYANAQSLFFSNLFSNNKDNEVNNNLFFASGGADSSEWQWNNVMYTGFAAYTTATGNDAASLFADPLFKEMAALDLHLTADSPAVDAGAAVTEAGGVDFDMHLRTQHGVMDIGAYEFGEETAVYLPIITTPQVVN